jgi:hypothetical protein
VITASFFGAINALGIGVLGEYIVRIYDQVRGRPKFVVARETGTSLVDERPTELDRDLLELLQHARAMNPMAEFAEVHRDTIELEEAVCPVG